MKIRTYIFLGFGLVIVLYTFNWFINYKLSKQVNTNTEFLTRSELVIRNSNQVHKKIIAMQSGFRGYLLTKNERYLEHYTIGLKEIPFLLSQQRSLVTNPAQHETLDSIRNLLQSWILKSAILIKASKDNSGLGMIKYERLFNEHFRTGNTKRLSDLMSDAFNDFDRIEYRVRKERRDKLQNSIDRTHIISVILVILIILIAILSALFIAKVITKRISTMVALAASISQGNFKLLINDTSHDELSDLSKTLNIMAGNLDKSFTELARKNNELDQFGYVVSHDLKAPLRGIDNIVRWIQEDHDHELSTPLKKYIELMKGRIGRLEALINGLLEYSKIGRVKLSTSRVNAKKLITEIVEVIVPEGFLATISANIPEFDAEKLRLEQVLSNLISNAVKYHNRTNGSINITCKEFDKEYFEFTVTDDGPGIAQEYHEKIFIIFQTLKEKDAFESTGVGLAIVKKIIEEQKGTIKLVSSPGEGSTFSFTWPKKPITNISIKHEA